MHSLFRCHCVPPGRHFTVYQIKIMHFDVFSFHVLITTPSVVFFTDIFPEPWTSNINRVIDTVLVWAVVLPAVFWLLTSGMHSAPSTWPVNLADGKVEDGGHQIHGFIVLMKRNDLVQRYIITDPSICEQHFIVLANRGGAHVFYTLVF